MSSYYKTVISEKEIIHILKCMYLIGAMSRDVLFSFIGTGSISAHGVTLRYSTFDFDHLLATVDVTRQLFDNFEGLKSCTPLCLGLVENIGVKHCTIRCGR